MIWGSNGIVSCAPTNPFAAIRAVFDALNALARAPCSSNETAEFFAGRVAFMNGRISELGELEAALGSNLGIARIPRLVFDGAPIDTRSPLSVLALYSSNPNARQAARDFSVLATSRGMAPIWQNVGRLPVARLEIESSPKLPLIFLSISRSNIPGDSVGNIGAANAIAADAYTATNSLYWAGLRGNGGFEKAFSPLASLLGSVLTDSVVVARAVAAA